jgi:hypothetical protein
LARTTVTAKALETAKGWEVTSALEWAREWEAAKDQVKVPSRAVEWVLE